MSRSFEFDAAVLRARRAYFRLSQAEVAERAGVAMSSVANWENERGTPPGSVIAKLAGVLEVEPGAFFRSVMDDTDAAQASA